MKATIDLNPTSTPIPASTVTFAMIQDLNANVVLGRSSQTIGDVEEIVCTAAGRAMLAAADVAAQQALLGVSTTNNPLYASLRLSSMTSGYVPYHHSVSGFISSAIYNLYTAGGDFIGLGTEIPSRKLEVQDVAGYPMRLQRNVYTAASDVMLELGLFDVAQFKVPYAGISGGVTVNTHLAHTGFLDFWTASAGSLVRRMRITAAGYVGIGTIAPADQLDVAVIAAGVAGNGLALSYASLAHGMTTVVPTNVAGKLSVLSATTGGLSIQGLSSSDAIGLKLSGINGGSSLTTACITLDAAKKNGTGVQAIAASETAFAITNNGTNLVSILGNGQMVFGAGGLAVDSLVATNDLTLTCGTDKTLVLGETVWGGVHVAGDGMRPGTSSPTYSTFISGTKLWAFSATVDQELCFVVPIPSTYKEGTAIYPHVHWVGSIDGGASQGVRWGLEYVWANIGEDFGSSVIVYGSIINPPDAAISANDHYETVMNGITPSAVQGLANSMLVCRLFRDADAVNDQYAGTAGLIEVEFRHQIDTMGARTATTK